MALTPQQEKVVNSRAKKILVLSCAGSGKTTVIVNRIMKLWEEGVQPEEVLALTFSNKAAQEMKKRIRKENLAFGTKTNVKTFHAFGLEIIRQYSLTIGFEKSVKIAKNNDVQAILKEIFRSRKETPVEGAEIINYLKRSKSFERYQHLPYYDELLDEYSSILRERCLVDMDDMIYIPVNLLNDNSNIRKVITDKYKYVFVDEYQDTNEAQNRLLDLIVGPETNICLVGDDDQAIYEWRGAKPGYIRKKAASGEYECIKLEKNFRSQAEIIGVANRIINKNNNRVQKAIDPFRTAGIKPVFQQLPSQIAESDWVAEKIRELISSDRFNPSDIAVLYRNNDQGDYIKAALTAKNIEYENAELDENARYSTFINVLQAIVDLSSSRDMGEALNFPTRCFDQFSYNDAKSAYCDLYGQNCNYSTMEWIDKIYLSEVEFDGSVEFRERYGIITQLHEAKDWTPTQVIAYYLSYMERKGYDKTQQEKYTYVLQAFDIAKNYEEVFENKSLKEFLDHLAISYETNDANRSKNIDAVNLMTMHRSKGLEFKVVFILGVQVGCMPNDYFIHTLADLEAERRLFYVALTRAKELLYLTSFRDPLGGSFKSDVVRNGFMAEIPETALGPAPSKDYLIDKLPPKDNVIDEKITPKDIEKAIKDTTAAVEKEIKEVVDSHDETKEASESVVIENSKKEEKEHNLGELTEEQIDKYLEESFALSKNIDIPHNCFVILLGAIEIKTSIAKAILKANSFGEGQVEIYDYDGKGFNINKYYNNFRCLGIIMGPNAHKLTGVDAKSLKSKLLVEQGYPFTVDLINKRITKQTLQEAITKIKWNYCKNNEG